jgi:5-(carboxyamino)imidazole ribonucleotide synthase
MCDRLIPGDWHEADDVRALGTAVRVVTLENEFVDAPALASVVADGTPVRPGPAAVAIIQDKADQKERLRASGIPVPRFAVADTARDVETLAADLGWPVVVKARRLGYDGRGNALCRGPEDVPDALARLDRGEGVLVEELVPFEAELAVMVARSALAEVVYPVAETVQKDHVCHEVRVPAPIAQALQDEARSIASCAAAAAQGLGMTGVEMFLVPGGEILVNELAPRPHNSGHYTIEACETSQFENHLRGVLGLPLGSAELRAPGAAMINLLGATSAPSAPDVSGALAVPGAHVHLYDKADVRPGRKMGHVTALGKSPGAALVTARRAAATVRL